MTGQFSEDSIANAVGLGGEDFQGLFEFARCQRSDGSFYGTRGKCRKGKQAGKRQQSVPKDRPRSESKPKTKPSSKKEPSAKNPKKYTIRLGENDNADALTKKKEEVLARLSKAGVKGKSFKDVEKHWNRMLSAVEENKKFASKLAESLPKEFKTSFSEDDGVVMTAKLKSGDVVRAMFSPSKGFHFTINGEIDAGSIKDRKSQIRAAFTVRTAFKAVVSSLPEGSVLKTGAHTEDGKGAERVRAYTRMGFSQPNKIGDSMFAVIGPGGSVIPASDGDYKTMKKKTGTLWFSEELNEEVKLWLQAIFGFGSV